MHLARPRPEGTRYPPAPRPPAPRRDALPAHDSRRPLEGTAPACPRSCRVHRTRRRRPPGGCFPDRPRPGGTHYPPRTSPARAPAGRATPPHLAPPAGGHGSGVPMVVPGAPHAETPPARRMFPRPPAPRRDALPPRTSPARAPAGRATSSCAPEGRAPRFTRRPRPRPGGTRSQVHPPAPPAARWRARLRRAHGRAGCTARGDAARQEDVSPTARAPAGRAPRFTPRTPPARAPEGRAPSPRLAPPAGGHGSGGPTVVPGAPHAETPPARRMFPRPRPRPGGTHYPPHLARPRPGGTRSQVHPPAPPAARWRARLRRAHGRAGCTARGDAARQKDVSPPAHAPAGRATLSSPCLRAAYRTPHASTPCANPRLPFTNRATHAHAASRQPHARCTSARPYPLPARAAPRMGALQLRPSAPRRFALCALRLTANLLIGY